MTKDKVRGMMLGVAIGDQLGMPVETYTREKISERHGEITSYIDPDANHQWFGGMKSRWTDDTQLTLVVVESLIEKRCVDMDSMARIHVWSYHNDGDLGWGKSTREAVKKLAAGVHWSESGALDFPKAGLGNGIPMKISPFGIYLLQKFGINPPGEDFNISVTRFTFMTHMKRIAVESAFAQIYAIRHCLSSQPANFSPKEFGMAVFQGAVLAQRTMRFFGNQPPLLSGRLLSIQTAYDTIKESSLNELIAAYGNSSYVYESLPFSYACFIRNPASVEALYETVNAGGDTDTNGSIVGALLGALNGTKIFPEHLINGLWQKEKILETADELCEAFEIKD